MSLANHCRRSMSNKASIIRRNVARKYKQGLDRLPSQGVDPSKSLKHGWRYASAAILERYPIIMPESHALECSYLQGRFLEQQRQSRPISPHMFLSEKDVTQGRTKPDMTDGHAEMYEPAGRTTQADRDEDRRSMERALDERLYFVVRRKAGGQFQFPQTVVTDDGVSMGRYAEAALKGVTTGGGRPKVYFVSHAPACHLEHVYGERYQERWGVYGLKIFFYRAMVMEGGIEEVRNVEEFAWAREGELEGMFGEKYFEAVRPVLFGVGSRGDGDSDGV